MATVGNLFVNVRGRTSGFVGDMKRAHRSVRKDFYRNEAIAREQYVRAIGKVQAARGQSPAIRGRMLDKSDVARRRLLIARSRPERLARRRELMMKKETLGALSFAAVSAVTGLSISALVGAIRFGVDSAKRGSQLTERFKFAGPMGGQIAQIEAQKVLQQLRLAQDPKVSGAKAYRAKTEFALEQSQMSLSTAYDYAIGFLNQAADFFLRGGSVRPGMAAIEQKVLMQQSTGLTGQGP